MDFHENFPDGRQLFNYTIYACGANYDVSNYDFFGLWSLIMICTPTHPHTPPWVLGRCIKSSDPPADHNWHPM